MRDRAAKMEAREGLHRYWVHQMVWDYPGWHSFWAFVRYAKWSMFQIFWVAWAGFWAGFFLGLWPAATEGQASVRFDGRFVI